MTESTYKFEYAIQRLREAINYSEQVRDYTQIRIWVNHVEAAYNADIEAEQELTRSANEGAHLMYMYGQGGESKLLRDWDLPSGTPEYKEAQQVSDKFNFDTVTEQEF